MTKKVRYNGGTESQVFSSNPKCLVVGKEYEVVEEKDRIYQINYVLRGIGGEFYSEWFENVDEETQAKPTVNIAVSKEVPKEGEKYYCSKIEFIEGKPKLVKCITSQVQMVEEVGVNAYYVRTHSNVYIVKIDTSK